MGVWEYELVEEGGVGGGKSEGEGIGVLERGGDKGENEWSVIGRIGEERWEGGLLEGVMVNGIVMWGGMGWGV